MKILDCLRNKGFEIICRPYYEISCLLMESLERRRLWKGTLFELEVVDVVVRFGDYGDDGDVVLSVGEMHAKRFDRSCS
ncbi:hypothetical protein Tco_0067143 [Tanacetum coccineum]